MNRIKNDTEFIKTLTQEYQILYKIGVQSGLRISDILYLTPSKFIGNVLKTIEKKTGKEKSAIMSDEVMEYISQFEKNERIFKMSRQSVWKVFKGHAKKLKIRHVGTHSMRKKYAYETYKKSRKLGEVQKALNHDYLGTTMVYLIDED